MVKVSVLLFNYYITKPGVADPEPGLAYHFIVDQDPDPGIVKVMQICGPQGYRPLRIPF
jgi:hypothetical protein